jgi:hypothetical protein
MSMSTEKDDTDPSSPGALRPSGRHPAAGHPTTDPGLGPRSRPQVPSHRSVSVVVPPPSARRDGGPNAITPPETPISAATFSNRDSVELLLEGMAGPRPDRRKATAQSDGEASAAYHAEHGVRRARTTSEPGPKVVVEKATSPGAVSRERPPTVRPKPLALSREALSTFVPARVLRRRTAMALLAGTLLVLLLFVGLKLTAKPHGSAAAAPYVTGADLMPPPVRAPAVASEVAAAPVAPPQAAVQPETPGPEGGRNAAAAARTPPATGPTGKGRRKTQGNGSNGTQGGDLGEFSTTF